MWSRRAFKITGSFDGIGNQTMTRCPRRSPETHDSHRHTHHEVVVPPSRIRRPRRAVTADTSDAAPILVQQSRQEQRGVGTVSIGTRLGCGTLGTMSPRHRHARRAARNDATRLNVGEGDERVGEGAGDNSSHHSLKLFLSLSLYLSLAWSPLVTTFSARNVCTLARTAHPSPRGDVHHPRLSTERALPPILPIGSPRRQKRSHDVAAACMARRRNGAKAKTHPRRQHVAH